MAPEPEERCPDDCSEVAESTNDEDTGGGDEDDEDDEDDGVEDDEEPRLKYVRLTGNLGSVYRNGDATSSILVAGDKMVGFLRHRLVAVGILRAAGHRYSQWQYCKFGRHLGANARYAFI